MDHFLPLWPLFPLVSFRRSITFLNSIVFACAPSNLSAPEMIALERAVSYIRRWACYDSRARSSSHRVVIMYRAEKKSWYVVARYFFLTLLSFSAGL